MYILSDGGLTFICSFRFLISHFTNQPYPFVSKKAKRQVAKATFTPKPAQDPSPYVHQRDKLDWDLSIRERNDLTEKQKALIELILDKHTKVVFISGPAGTSKAQPFDAEIVTPSGIKQMGTIKPGDEIFAIDGKPCKVLSIHPQGVKDIYRVTFSDGTHTECCLDHLWFTQTNDDRYARARVKGAKRGTRIPFPREGSVKTLSEIINTLYVGNDRPNHYIPLTQPLQIAPSPHVIPPYLMGALLGDGCFRKTGSVGFTTTDPEILARLQKEMPSSSRIKQITDSIDYEIQRNHPTEKNGVLESTKTMGLYGLYSYQKHIPTTYLFDSLENRIELLRGLMDTDGTTSEAYTSYSTTSPDLARDIRFLISSLGGTCSLSTYPTQFPYKGEIHKGKNIHVISIVLPPHINPFYLPRKRNRYRPNTKYLPSRSIVFVEPVGKKEAQCILIDHPSHLYLTSNCIVTHNTWLAVYCGLLLLQQRRVSHITFVRTIAESASKSLGYLPGELEDKIGPYLKPMMDKLEELLPSGDIKRLMAEDRIHGLPVNHLRGASLNAQYIVLEESQNWTSKELTTALTRIGQYSKCVVIGDPMQADINGASAFQPFYDLFNEPSSQEQGIHCLSFTKDDIVRSGILRHLIDRIEWFNANRAKEKSSLH